MRKALGRGLEALIPTASTPAAEQSSGSQTLKVPIDKIRANHLQPRKYFDPEKISELACSIKEHGLAQPILVSQDAQGETYEIIAGERRFRACELAGLSEIEVIVRSPESDQKRLSLALIENLQREDLNPIEQALGYLRLMKEFHISQTELTKVVGKSKSAISNTLRLLELSDEFQKALEFGQITEGHARALLMTGNVLERKLLFDIILKQKLSVRETEDFARKINEGQSLEKSSSSLQNKDIKSADIKSIESSIQEALGTKVEIKVRKDPKKGQINLHFYSLEDFDKIVKKLLN